MVTLTRRVKWGWGSISSCSFVWGPVRPVSSGLFEVHLNAYEWNLLTSRSCGDLKLYVDTEPRPFRVAGSPESTPFAQPESDRGRGQESTPPGSNPSHPGGLNGTLTPKSVLTNTNNNGFTWRTLSIINLCPQMFLRRPMT